MSKSLKLRVEFRENQEPRSRKAVVDAFAEMLFPDLFQAMREMPAAMAEANRVLQSGLSEAERARQAKIAELEEQLRLLKSA